MSARRNGIPTLSEAVDYPPAQLFEPVWQTRGRCAELPIAESDRMFTPSEAELEGGEGDLC